jgi:protein KRI1
VKITDYQRELLLKNGGLVDDEDTDKMHGNRKILTHAEEEEQLKAELKAAIENSGINEGDEADLLIKRQKTEEEIAADEEEYKKFLLESVAVRIQTRDVDSLYFSPRKSSVANKCLSYL